MSDNAVVEFSEDGITVDAGVIADGLGIAPAAVQAGMREGTITSRCERGIGRHAGRYRLTFFHHGRGLRLIVDETCRIVGRAVVPLRTRPTRRSAQQSQQG
jgi:hypothetical protein